MSTDCLLHAGYLWADSPAPSSATGPVIPLLTIYSLAIIAASLVGGWLPSFVRLTHTRMQLLISFVGGLMLGIGLFHLLTHAAYSISIEQSILWAMLGIVTMFFLLRFFHFHQHEPVGLHRHEESGLPQGHESVASAAEESTAETEKNKENERGKTRSFVAASLPTEESVFGEAHAAHHVGHAHALPHAAGVHRYSWVGIAAGLVLHTLIDGVALGASVQAAAGRGDKLSLLGFGTFLAIVLHKPLDAVSITTLMAASGWSLRWRNIVNAGFSLMCPLGAVLVLFGLEWFAGLQNVILGSAMAFSGGVFICIALSDLLPEMELHSHNRLQLSAALLAGILLAWGIGQVEPGENSAGPHLHFHPPPVQPANR